MSNFQNQFFKDLPIWFINLESSSDRLRTMTDSFKEYGISEYKVISAVDGKDKDYSVQKASYHTKELTSGEMAANLSYIKLINEFLLSRHEYIVMCDDDVDFKNSVHLDFNFYDTLKYHNPIMYSLKLNALDISYWFDEKIDVPVNKIIKPSGLSLGNATIINRAWAKNFLKKYDVFRKETNEIDKSFIYRYEKNVGKLNSFTIPACDAITFDEHTLVWRIFGIFEFDSTLNPDYFNEDDHNEQRLKQIKAYNYEIDNYDWSSSNGIEVFKNIIREVS